MPTSVAISAQDEIGRKTHYIIRLCEIALEVPGGVMKYLYIPLPPDQLIRGGKP